MARYENKGPVMQIPRSRNMTSTWNTATGERKQLPSKFNTRTGELGPATYGETGTTRDDFAGGDEASLYEMNQGIDPSSFDVSDPEQVLAFQRQAGLEEDAMFGPKTQEAWEKYVNSRRQREGGGDPARSLVDLVNDKGVYKKGPESKKRIDELVRENEEAGMYQGDIDTGDDDEYGLGDFFRNAWSKWTN